MADEKDAAAAAVPFDFADDHKAIAKEIFSRLAGEQKDFITPDGLLKFMELQVKQPASCRTAVLG